MRLLLILTLFALLPAACRRRRHETREEYVQRALREKIERFKARKRERCEQNLLAEAEAIADSIILREALNADTIRQKIPHIPPKPAFIEPRVPDTTAAKPILDSLR